MKRYPLLGILVFCFLGAQAQWTQLTAPNSTLFSNYHLIAVDFVDDQVGYAAGNFDSTINGRNLTIGSVILKTTNGGSTWSVVYEKVDSMGIQQIEAASATEVIATGGRWGQYNQVIRTRDGGTTWIDVTGNLPKASRDYTYLYSASMTPSGDFHIGTRLGTNLRTRDLGDTWYEGPTVNNAGLSATFFETDSLGFYGTTSGRIHVTRNGGQVGGYLGYPQEDLRTIYSWNNGQDILYGGTGWGGRTGYVKKSTDGGQNFAFMLQNTMGGRVTKIERVVADNFVISLQGGNTAMISEDAGQTWNFMQAPTSKDMHDVAFATPTFGIMVGDDQTILQYSGFAIEPVNLPIPNLCGGGSFDIAYDMTSDFTVGSGNSFTAELSDQAGSFANPTTIGVYSSTALRDTFTVTLPTTVAAGLYKLRLIGSNVTPRDTSLVAELKVGLDAPTVTITNANGTNTNFVCAAGDSLTITAPSGFTNYEWSNGLQGNNLNTVKLAAGDSINLVVSQGNCKSVPSNTIRATLAPDITGTVQPTATSACGAADGSATFNPQTPNNPQIIWGSNTGSQSGPTANNLRAGQYTVTVSNGATGCSKTFTVTVPDGGAPANEFTTGLKQSFCSNDDAMTLSADSSATTFSGPGVTGTSFDPASAGVGNHQLIATLVSGSCTVYDTLDVSVSAAPAQPSVQTGSMSKIQNPMSGMTYTWLQNGTVLGTGDSLATSAGTYQIVVSDGTCESDTLTFAVASIEQQLASSAYRVFPNPNKGNFSLRFDHELRGEVFLTDITGKTLLTRSLDGNDKGQLDFKLDLPKGLYLLQLATPKGRATTKLIID